MRTPPGAEKFRRSSGAPPPALADELVPHREAPAEDARLHGPDLRDGDRRDLLVAESLDVPQEQGVALLDRDERERGLDRGERLMPGDDLGEVRTARRGLGPARVAVRVVRRVER